MKEFFKKLLEKVKNFLLKLWEKIKTWAVERLWPWLKREWVTFGSIAVLILAYMALPEENKVAGLLIGPWLFVLAAVSLFRLFSKPKPNVVYVEVEKIVEKIVEVEKSVEKPQTKKRTKK